MYKELYSAKFWLNFDVTERDEVLCGLGRIWEREKQRWKWVDQPKERTGFYAGLAKEVLEKIKEILD